MAQLGKPCDCVYPFLQLVGDVVIGKPNDAGKVLANRYCDCIFHGPFVVKVETKARYDEWGDLISRDFGDVFYGDNVGYGGKRADVVNRLRDLS